MWARGPMHKCLSAERSHLNVETEPRMVQFTPWVTYVTVGVSSYHDLINMHERPIRPLLLGVTWSTKPHLGYLPSGHCHSPFKKARTRHALHYCHYQLPDHLYSLQEIFNKRHTPIQTYTDYDSHPAGSSVNFAFCKKIKKFWLNFTIVANVKIFGSINK